MNRIMRQIIMLIGIVLIVCAYKPSAARAKTSYHTQEMILIGLGMEYYHWDRLRFHATHRIVTMGHETSAGVHKSWTTELTLLVGRYNPGIMFSMRRNNAQWLDYRMAATIELELDKPKSAQVAAPNTVLQGDLILLTDGDAEIYTGWRFRYANLRYDPVWDRYGVELEEHFAFIGIDAYSDTDATLRIGTQFGVAYTRMPYSYAILPHQFITCSVVF